MNLTIELSDEKAEALKAQAAAHGLTVEKWVEKIAEELAQPQLASIAHLQKTVRESGRASFMHGQEAAARILELQKRVKPDPEGWTVHDYINHGRH
jgi:hypothetical protein